MQEILATPEYVSVKRASEMLGLTIAQTDDLLRRNEVESRTSVVLSSLTDYIDRHPA